MFISDHENIARILIEKGANVNAEDKDKQTPLYHATDLGNRAHFNSKYRRWCMRIFIHYWRHSKKLKICIVQRGKK